MPEWQEDLKIFPYALHWFQELLKEKEIGIQDKKMFHWMTARGIVEKKTLSKKDILIVTPLGKHLADVLSNSGMLIEAIQFVENWPVDEEKLVDKNIPAKVLDSKLISKVRTKINSGPNPCFSRLFIETLYFSEIN